MEGSVHAPLSVLPPVPHAHANARTPPERTRGEPGGAGGQVVEALGRSGLLGRVHTVTMGTCRVLLLLLLLLMMMVLLLLLMMVLLLLMMMMMLMLLLLLLVMMI